MPLGRFQLEQQAIIDDQICPECVVYDNAIIPDWDDDLPGNTQPSFCKHLGEDYFVYAFQQTRTDIGMQPEATIDNDSGDSLQFVIARHLCVLVS